MIPERRPLTKLGESMMSGPDIIGTPYIVGGYTLKGWARRARGGDPPYSVDGQPAVEISDDQNRVRIREWYEGDYLGRGNDLPAVETIDEDGQLRAEEWYRNGHLHRDGDLPAVKTYDNNGQLHSSRRYQNGVPMPQPGSSAWS